MNETERYLRRATHGLSGQARRDAQLELRGAIEDKIWRLTLLGLPEAEATQAALRDLGNPHTIARGLTRVHTVPRAALAAVLAGVATLLGVQALAQVPVVQAARDPSDRFCVYDEAVLKEMTPARQAALLAQLARPGGRAQLEADCRATSPAPRTVLLRLSDLIAALVRGNIGVRTLPPLDGFLYLTFAGEGAERTLDLSAYSIPIGKDTYVQTWSLINHLRSASPVPVRLIGEVNPLLEIGAARLQLGTPEAPVLAMDLYAAALADQLHSNPLSVLGKPITVDWGGMEDPASARTRIAVNAPDDVLFVLVTNEWLIGTPSPGGPGYLFRVLRARRGQLATSYQVKKQQGLVDTVSDLVNATEQRQKAMLLYRLDPRDLREVKLIPVPGSQLTLQPTP